MQFEFCLKFGSWNRFYWLIIFSAVIKILISFFYNLSYQGKDGYHSITFLFDGELVLIRHIFVMFIYYYFGYFLLGFIFQKRKQYRANKELKIRSNSLTIDNGSVGRMGLIFERNIPVNKSNIIIPLVFSEISLIISDIVMFYVHQNFYNIVNYWILEAILMHIFLAKERKIARHQKFAFILIFVVFLTVYLGRSFFPQCEFYRDEKMEKGLEETINKLPIIMKTPEMIKKIWASYNKTMDDGKKNCANMYNSLILEEDSAYYPIIIAAILYLISLILHSYSCVKLNSLINKRFLSLFSIIMTVGFIGLIMNIIMVLFAHFLPCGNSDNSANVAKIMCKSTYVDSSTPKQVAYYYLDNVLSYIVYLKDRFENQKTETNRGLVEIIITCFFPIFSFIKVYFDLLILKQLGAFYLLFSELISQFVQDIAVFIYKCNLSQDGNGNIPFMDDVQIVNFLVSMAGYIITFFGFAIYLELIEWKWCGMNLDTKKNIAERGESEIKSLECDLNNSQLMEDEQ